MALIVNNKFEKEQDNPSYKTEVVVSYREEKRPYKKKILELRTCASDKAKDQSKEHKRQVIDIDREAAIEIINLLKNYFDL